MTEELSTQMDDLPGQSTGRFWRNLPLWMIVVVLIFILFIVTVLTSEKYQETLQILVFGRPSAEATEGLLLTIRITLIAFGIATLLGLLTGLARVSNNPIIYNIATFYVEVIRGIPLVVLILYIAFVLPPMLIGIISALGTWFNDPALAGFTTRDLNLSFEVRGIIALAFGYGAYEAEVFRAGIQSIERGQMEAARSLGMTYFQAMRYVILPQAVRRVLPPLGNDFISLLKDSSLLTVIAVAELTQLGRVTRASTFRVFEVFNSVAILYLSMTLVLSFLVRKLERRMSSERQTETIR